jgi:hypothetical protein
MITILLAMAGFAVSVPADAGREVTDLLDGRSRLAEVTDNAASGAPVGVEWLFDDAGRRSSATRANGVSSVFTYDLNDRLTRIQHARDVSPAAFVFDVEFGYDAVGNRTWQRDHVRTSQGANYGDDPSIQAGAASDTCQRYAVLLCTGAGVPT